MSKVVMEMFPEYEFAYTIEEMYIVEDEQKRVIGRCIALSEENESKT